MKPKHLLRLAAIMLLIFALGHSMGHFTRHNVTDPKAIEVQKQMIENKFDMFGTMRSYDENYDGMSINLILTLFTFVIVLWIMSNHISASPQLVRAIMFPLMFCVLAFGITSTIYFFPGPATTCFIAFAAMLIASTRIK